MIKFSNNNTAIAKPDGKVLQKPLANRLNTEDIVNKIVLSLLLLRNDKLTRKLSKTSLSSASSTEIDSKTSSTSSYHSDVTYETFNLLPIEKDELKKRRLNFESNNNSMSNFSLGFKNNSNPANKLLNDQEYTIKNTSLYQYENGINRKLNMSVTDYVLNSDWSNAEIIIKKPDQNFKLNYVQDIAIKYLKPPTPELEPIIIREEDQLATPEPPVIIRQVPKPPKTPEPIVIREAPPRPPAAEKKVIIVPGKKKAAPRKIIFEKYPELPTKPQPIIIEKWLPFENIKRKIILEKSPEPGQDTKTKNVIFEYKKPDTKINKEMVCLGVTKANPNDYVQKYGSTLKSPDELPRFLRDIRQPEFKPSSGSVALPNKIRLEGDVHALKMIDLDKFGLSEYKSLVEKL